MALTRIATVFSFMLNVAGASPCQSEMPGRAPDQASKVLIIRMINADKPGFPLDRLEGSIFRLKSTEDSSGGRIWTSTPLEVHDCLGTARVTDVPAGRYGLEFEPFKLEGAVNVPGKPIPTLVIRVEMIRGGAIRIRTIEISADAKLPGTLCALITHRITITNPEEDLDAPLRALISRSLEEGKIFREEDLEKAINAINALNLFSPLSRRDCAVRLTDSSDQDLVDITINLRRK
jgi:hypothetical protein